MTRLAATSFLAMSFASMVASAQPAVPRSVTSSPQANKADRWKKPKAAELALRQAHAEATAQHASVNSELITVYNQHLRSATGATSSKVATLSTQVRQLQTRIADLDSQIFEAELTRAPRSLLDRYDQAKADHRTSAVRQQASTQKYLDYIKPQDRGYYDYERGEAINKQRTEANNALRKTFGKIEAVKLEIREGAKP